MTPKSARRKLRNALLQIGITEKLPRLWYGCFEVPTKPSDIVMFGLNWQEFEPGYWVKIYAELQKNGL